MNINQESKNENDIIKLLSYIITKKIIELPENAEFKIANILVEPDKIEEYCYIDIELQNKILNNVRDICSTYSITLEKNPNGQRFANPLFVDFIKFNTNK